MNPALTAKIKARIGNEIQSCDGLLRYLQNKQEKKFVIDMMAESKNIEYFLKAWRGLKTLNRIDNMAMANILGLQIDLQNIIWAYRLKNFYGITGEASYGFMVPIRHRLSKETFTRITMCKDTRSLQQELETTNYKNVFGNFENPEECLFNMVKAKYRTEGRRSHIALLCGYIYEVHK